MTMGDRIHPGHGKSADADAKTGQARTNPPAPIDADREDPLDELHTPHIEPAAITDAPGS